MSGYLRGTVNQRPCTRQAVPITLLHWQQTGGIPSCRLPSLMLPWGKARHSDMDVACKGLRGTQHRGLMQPRTSYCCPFWVIGRKIGAPVLQFRWLAVIVSTVSSDRIRLAFASTTARVYYGIVFHGVEQQALVRHRHCCQRVRMSQGLSRPSCECQERPVNRTCCPRREHHAAKQHAL